MISSTLLQYIILIYLEKKSNIDESAKISISSISLYFGIDISIILNELNGMVFNNFNKLGKITDGLILVDCLDNKITEENSVSINRNFSNSNIKFSIIPVVSVKKTKDQMDIDRENDEKMKQRYEDQMLDATITRIMKGRIGKETCHSFLIHEVQRQIELFLPKVEHIKSRIERLIEGNFIRRTNGFADMYEYIS